MSKIIEIKTNFDFIYENFLCSSTRLIENLCNYKNQISIKDYDDIINYFLYSKKIRKHNYECDYDEDYEYRDRDECYEKEKYCQENCRKEPNFENKNKLILKKLLRNFKNIKNEDKVKYINTLFLFYKIDTTFDVKLSIIIIFNKIVGWEYDKDFDYIYHGCTEEYLLDKILYFIKMPGKFKINDLYFFNNGDKNEQTNTKN